LIVSMLFIGIKRELRTSMNETLGSPSLARSCFCAQGGRAQLLKSSFCFLQLGFVSLFSHAPALPTSDR
jgi:hypothetical protein